MADVAVVLKLLPDDSDTDISKIIEKIEPALGKICRINKIAEQELAFGLKSIRLEVIVPDEEGKIGAVEAKLQEIEGIGQVDTEDVTLV